MRDCLTIRNRESGGSAVLFCIFFISSSNRGLTVVMLSLSFCFLIIQIEAKCSNNHSNSFKIHLTKDMSQLLREIAR